MKFTKKKDNQDYALRKKLTEQSIALIFFVVIAVVLINSILIYTRFDLTGNKIYSISKVSQKIIQEIEDPVYIDYYISEKLKSTQEQPQQIIDLLQEYGARSRGKVIVSIRNASDDKFQKDLQRYKIEPRQLELVEKDQASFASVYSGIVISFQERFRVMPFVYEPASIEYQITSKIMEVYNDEDREVGILILDSNLSKERDVQALYQVLGADYKVLDVEKDKPIQGSIDALFVIGSSDITNTTAYYIDQYLMSGKGVFFATDRAKVSLQQGINVSLNDTLLVDMIENYGVQIEPTIVADELNKFIPLSQPNGFQTLQPYALFITISGQNVNQDHPITARFGGLDLFWTSPLSFSKNEENFTALVSSSKKSWTLAATAPQIPNSDQPDAPTPPKQFNAMPDPANFIAYRDANNEKSYTVVAAVLGNMTSAVESGIITPPSDAEGEYKAKAPQGRMLVVGSSAFLTQLYRVSNAGYNFTFLSSASEWLGSNEELLQIKSRVVRDIQLNKITDEDKKAGLAFFVKILNMAIIPLLIIVAAILVLFYRRNLSKRRY